MTYLLDASALLAAMLGEPGGERVVAISATAAITTVNLAEVAQRLTKMSGDDDGVAGVLRAAALTVIDVDAVDALAAGIAYRLTRPSGLSLADRFCLVAARRRGLIAVTADRGWLGIDSALAVEIEFIR